MGNNYKITAVMSYKQVDYDTDYFLQNRFAK